MRKIILFIILAVFVSSFFPLGARALTISPPKFEFSADPGDTLTGQITLINTENREMTLYSSFEGVEVIGSWGEPRFTGERVDLASWITTSRSEVTLALKARKVVSFRIDVPEDAEPGGHYAAIFWGTASPAKEGGTIGLASRIAILILLDVSGDVVEEGELIKFGSSEKLFSYLPVQFNYTLESTGNVHLKPQGKLIVKNILGKTKAVLEANPDGHSALPGAVRTFPLFWEPETPAEADGEGFFANLRREKADFAFGYYRAKLSIEFGKELKTAQASFGFWILPWRIMLLSFLALVIFVVMMIFSIKRYNRWIISKARTRTRTRTRTRK